MELRHERYFVAVADDLWRIGLGLPKETEELEIVQVAEERLIAAVPGSIHR